MLRRAWEILESKRQGRHFLYRADIDPALIVRVAEEVYALPLATVEGVVRLPRNIVMRQLSKDAPPFEYGNQKYRFQQLGAFVGLGVTRLPETDVSMPVVLIRAGEHSTALVTDELVGSREIVVKSLGPQVSGIRGIAGATILGDGRIVIAAASSEQPGGFDADDVAWLLRNAPGEIVVLRGADEVSAGTARRTR